MDFSYYPGCTLKTKAKDLDRYARRAAASLGIHLTELPAWQCCGAVYPQASDEIAARLSAVRALAGAKALGQELVTLCSACHHVLKRVNLDMACDETIRARANSYLQLDVPYGGETSVIHYLELLRDKIGFDAVRAKVVKPLAGRKIAAYYGCLLLRPGKEMQMDNPENPTILEDFIRALGGEPVLYPLRNECCGAYITMENKALAVKRSSAVMESAVGAGAAAIVTACPLCLYNLCRNSDGPRLPVCYFTELLAEALGVKREEENV